MGVLGANTNKELWGEDALEWKPERWLEPLPDAVMEAPIPGIYNKSWVTVQRPLHSTIDFPLAGWRSWEASGHVCKCFFREATCLSNGAYATSTGSGFKFAEMEMSTSSCHLSSRIPTEKPYSQRLYYPRLSLPSRLRLPRSLLSGMLPLSPILPTDGTATDQSSHSSSLSSTKDLTDHFFPRSTSFVLLPNSAPAPSAPFHVCSFLVHEQHSHTRSGYKVACDVWPSVA